MINKKILTLAVVLALTACSDNKAADLTDKQVEQYVAQPLTVPPPQRGQYTDTPPAAPQQEDVEASGYSDGELAAGIIAGAAVGALAANALSSSNTKEVERCDHDDHPNEPECRGTAKYYKWKAEQKRKAEEAAKKRKSVYKSYKRKPR